MIFALVVFSFYAVAITAVVLALQSLPSDGSTGGHQAGREGASST